MTDIHFMYGVPMKILKKRVASTQNTIQNAESHPTNYSPNFTSDRATLGSLLFLVMHTAVLSCQMQSSLISQQALISGQMLTGTVLLIEVSTIPL
jgi:hypothetical protein